MPHPCQSVEEMNTEELDYEPAGTDQEPEKKKVSLHQKLGVSTVAYILMFFPSPFFKNSFLPQGPSSPLDVFMLKGKGC